MKNAFEKATAKNAEKKSIGCDRMRRVGVMCWASGEVRRGHTSYDSLRRIQIRIQIKLFSTPRRPAKGGGFQRLRLMPPTPASEINQPVVVVVPTTLCLWVFLFLPLSRES